jgi:hypothetical protein
MIFIVPPGALRKKFPQLAIILGQYIILQLWNIFCLVLKLFLSLSNRYVWLPDLSFFKKIREVFNVGYNGRNVLVPPHHFLVMAAALI